jgi:kinesin family protein 4/21/27
LTAQISKLNKQLTHCESDLRANIDLVSTLEGALNDSERNIRKARLQMTDLTKERDTLQHRAEELQRQVEEATAASQDAHESQVAAQQEADDKLARERAARDAAKQQLDRRIEEMRARKSKFAVRAATSCLHAQLTGDVPHSASDSGGW